MKCAWVVSEGSPGHDSQSRGLADALAKLHPLRIIEVNGRTTVRGWQRPLLRMWMAQTGQPLSERMLQRVTDLRIPEDAPQPALIIASGGKSVFAARSLAVRHRAPMIYLGEQKRYPDHWFDLIISPVPDDPRPNALRTEIIPTTMSPAKAHTAAAHAQRPSGRLWAMIVGGASRSHRYTDADWTALAHGMNGLSKREGIRWLLTTSRRTGAHAERLLKQTLAPDTLADAIWWSEAPRRELHAFLGMSEMAFVTQDSVTMVSEAVASGRPVLALRPGRTHESPNGFLSRFFERLHRNGRMHRIEINQLDRFTEHDAPTHRISGSVLDALAQEVADRIKLTSVGNRRTDQADATVL